jgi:YD repeat-containing protein
LDPGHWTQTVTTGNAKTVTYLDALLRPLYTSTSDVANPSATARVVQRRFDPAGHTVFESYPKRTVAETTTGTSTEYDALGRVVKVEADSELGILRSTVSYIGGFQKTAIDPLLHSTTTAFQAFDEPVESAVTSIAAPLGVQVQIARDIFGKTTSITRSGSGKSVTRSYVYDLNARLCKTIEPETAATLQAYDTAGNVAWRAAGLALPTLACDRESVTAAKKTTFGYDAINQLSSTTYGDGSPGITRTYWPDGLPKTVSSNGTGWTYLYNNRRLNQSEALVYGGNTYTTTKTYDVNGSLSSLQYPDNAIIGYKPNALGEPSQVGAYASEVVYHPNGAIKSFKYGNGIAHTLKQNARGLPEISTDVGVISDTYAFDKSGNVTSITDGQQGISSRVMAYDDLDRLRTVSAPGMWGSAGFTYDALDNLSTSTISSGATARTLVHNYDASNKLSGITGTAAFAFGYGYDSQGNITRRGTQNYIFDQANRMTSAGGKATYIYDGLGRRVSSVGTDSVNRVQVYSQAGQLLWSGVPGRVGTKYIYLHNHVIAEVTQ